MFKVLVLYGHGATSVTATEKVPINYHIENKVLCMCVCGGGGKLIFPKKDMMRLRALSYLPSIIYYLYGTFSSALFYFHPFIKTSDSRG